MPERATPDDITFEDALRTDAVLDHNEVMGAVAALDIEVLRTRFAVQRITDWCKLIVQCMIAFCVGWCIGEILVVLFK